MQVIISIFTLLTLTTFSFGFDFWNDLRVTWSLDPKVKGAYDQLPRNIIDAELHGWKKGSEDCTNNGHFNGFRYTHPSDTGIALLYDPNGYVVGIQSLIPKKELDVEGQTVKFDHVPMYQTHTIDGVSYYVVTVYFQVPAHICNNVTSQGGNIGKSSLVYFQNGPSPKQLKVAYKSRTDATLNGWTVNQCVPGMGWHNFYDVPHYEESRCTDIQPTCLLFNKYDQLFGFCLTYPGNATSPRFEHPASKAIARTLGTAPQCILDLTDRIGYTTVHIYFTNTPWEVTC